MKIKYIFVGSTPKDNIITQYVDSYFYGYTIGVSLYNDIEIINPRLATAFACFSCSLARRGGVVSSLFYTYLIFYSMPKNSRKVSKANNSILTSASVHDTDTLSFSDLVAILQFKFETEKNAKNTAYAFILSRGLLTDYQLFSQHERSDNPMSDCLSMIELYLTQNN